MLSCSLHCWLAGMLLGCICIKLITLCIPSSIEAEINANTFAHLRFQVPQDAASNFDLFTSDLNDLESIWSQNTCEPNWSLPLKHELLFVHSCGLVLELFLEAKASCSSTMWNWNACSRMNLHLKRSRFIGLLSQPRSWSTELILRRNGWTIFGKSCHSWKRSTKDCGIHKAYHQLCAHGLVPTNMRMLIHNLINFPLQRLHPKQWFQPVCWFRCWYGVYKDLGDLQKM